MSKYLDRLKSGKQLPHELQKVQKPPFDSFCSSKGEHISEIQGAAATDLRLMVGEALAEVDRLGRPWPVRFLADLPAEDRNRLREIEKNIDSAVLAGDAVKVAGLLEEWRVLLLRRMN